MLGAALACSSIGQVAGVDGSGKTAAEAASSGLPSSVHEEKRLMQTLAHLFFAAGAAGAG